MEKVIICVDDEQLILQSLKSQLAEEFGDDFILEFAESGEEGLEILDELYNDVDVEPVAIISDWLMPNMKGDEFLKEVHNTHPEINKVMLSGYIDMTIVDSLKSEVGLNGFISKPWDKNELLRIIHECTDNYISRSN